MGKEAGLGPFLLFVFFFPPRLFTSFNYRLSVGGYTLEKLCWHSGW
jgi:hypothetical protein